MTEAADIAGTDERMLGRLAELDLAAAERVHARLMDAEGPGEVADLGRAYQRLARSLRQTLALKAKLRLDRERAARDAVDHRVRHSPVGSPLGAPLGSPLGAARPFPAEPPPVERTLAARLDALRAAALRLAWREAEAEAAETERSDAEADAGEDAGEAESVLGIFRSWAETIDEALLEDDFGDGPLDERLAALCRLFDFDAASGPGAARAWRDLPDPPPEALAAAPPPWRSSA